MSHPADGGECLAERRIRDRARVQAKHWRRARREYPDSCAGSIGEETLDRWRAHHVRARFKPGPVRCWWLDPNPRRWAKVMSPAEKRALDSAAEACRELGVRCKLSRFRE